VKASRQTHWLTPQTPWDKRVDENVDELASSTSAASAVSSGSSLREHLPHVVALCQRDTNTQIRKHDRTKVVRSQNPERFDRDFRKRAG
jgi:hypothetical protein